jgi:hypothetical protein
MWEGLEWRRLPTRSIRAICARLPVVRVFAAQTSVCSPPWCPQTLRRHETPIRSVDIPIGAGRLRPQSCLRWLAGPGTMRYLMHSLTGRAKWAVAWVAVVSFGVLGVSCSEASSKALIGTTTSIVETGTSVATPLSTTVADSDERRCMRFAPSDHRVFAKAQAVTIADLRNVVVATPPPTPTSLLLPGHAASEDALMCWSTSGDGTSVAMWWVTKDNQSRMLCVGGGTNALSQDPVHGFVCP